MRNFLLMMASCFACNDSAPDPRVPDWSGIYTSIYAESASQRPCAGSLPHVDRFIEQVSGLLNESIPEDLLIEVHIDDTLQCDLALGEVGACYSLDKKTVYMDSWETPPDDVMGVMRHEVAHAVADRLWGWSIPFFNEGLAEAVARSDQLHISPNVVAPVGDMLDGDIGDIDYRATARFSRFLIDDYGIARYKQMYQATQRRSVDEILANFLEVYGKDFSTLESEYLSGTPRCTYQFDVCDLSTAVLVGAVWSSSFVASCEDPDFYGAAGSALDGSASAMSTSVMLDVRQAGTYYLRSEAPVVFGRCGPCEVQSAQSFWSGETEVTLDIGIYTVQLSLDGGSQAVFSLELAQAADGDSNL